MSAWRRPKGSLAEPNWLLHPSIPATICCENKRWAVYHEDSQHVPAFVAETREAAEKWAEAWADKRRA